MTPEQVRDLKASYGSADDATLARRLGVSRSELHRVAAQLCLSKNKAKFPGVSMPRWSDHHVTTLRELYPAAPNLEIARLLGRSVKSVVSKAHALGLKKNPQRLREMGRENVNRRWNR